MRIKKGFTLAEILIVLMVIGVIATMTVPSLMKGVNDATYKTAYKKAFNAVTNIAAVEKIAGQLPNSNTPLSVCNFFTSLDANLSVKEYVSATKAFDVSKAEDLQTTSQGFTAYDLSSVGTGCTDFKKGTGGTAAAAVADRTPWIVSEDNIAYSVIPAPSGTCENKLVVNSKTTAADAAKAACVIVVVDVNGLAKSPNKFEKQATGDTKLTSSTKLAMLEGDRFYIFVASDGVAAGPKAATLSGRLMSDMK